MRTMKTKTAFILMILIATIIPGALGEWLIVSIPDSESDVWMTEIGNIFAYESSVRILDDSIGLHSFIRFEDVGISKSDKINYATLYVYAGFDQGETPDPGASVTIYGIDEPDCAPFSYSGNVWSLGRPYTSASVNWNLTTWGYGWHSVNVTDIVKEIVNQYAWTENNSLGFQILGASGSGQEVRTFEDIDHQHSGNHAYLYIQFNDAEERPDGLPDTAVWEETYGEYDIWSINCSTSGYEDFDDLDYYTETDLSGILEISMDGRKVAFTNADGDLTFYLERVSYPVGTSNFSVRYKVSVASITYTSGRYPIYFFMIKSGGNYIQAGIRLMNSTHFQLTVMQDDGTPSGFPLVMDFQEGIDLWYILEWDLNDDDKFTQKVWESEPVDWETNYSRTRTDGIEIAFKDQIWNDVFVCSDGTTGVHDADGYIDYMKIIRGAEEFIDIYLVTDENGTVIDTWTQEGENFTNIDDLKDFIDDYVDPQGGDPLDPTPGTQGWTDEGPFTRFRMRLYFLVIGLGCIFGPLWAMAYKKFDAVGYAWCALIMILGTGLLWSIVGI